MSVVLSLNDVCNIQSGGTPSRSKSEFWDGDIPWAKISDIENAKGTLLKTEEKITDQGLAAIRNRIFEPGTLLFAMYGSVGKTAIAGVKVSTNQAILGITINDKNKLDMSYLRHWLASQQSSFEKDARGVAQKNLSAGYVRDLKIPLPPLEEQKSIAAILDKADAIRRKRQQAIDLTDQLLRSVFLDMFGDPESKGWGLSKVEDLALQEKGSVRTGPFGSQLLHSEFTDSGIAVLGIDNAVENKFKWAKPRYITEEKYQQLKRYRVKPLDLLITIMGTCGRTAIVPEDIPVVINTKHLCCITLNQELCTPEFLHSYFLMHPVSKEYLERTAKGAVMDGLNMGIIKELPVYLPPIELQRKYSEIYKRIDVRKVSYSSSLVTYEELFSSISQRAFRGDLSKQTKAA